MNLDASMEPLPQGSGNGKAAEPKVKREQASMEPLPQGSGNELAAHTWAARAPASMEPLPQGSGNAGSARTAAAAPGCFNGATPSGEWKLVDSAGNSFPITALQWSHSLRGVETTIAPQRRSISVSLQWSHSLRGVETTLYPSFGVGWAVLQWSHSLRGVETDELDVPLAQGICASMEPLPQGSGNASARWYILYALNELQWSHSLRGVETRSTPRSWKSRSRLQWSHSLRGVETSAGWPDARRRLGASMEPLPQGSGNAAAFVLPPRSVSGFNGATPSGEWKLAVNMAPPPAPTASMEPLPQGSGNDHSVADRGPLLAASMEPLPQGSGNA